MYCLGMSPSVSLITSLGAAALCSLCDNRDFVNIPQKPLQSVDLSQKCHSCVASWLQYTGSLKTCRVLSGGWGQSLFRCSKELELVVLVDTSPSLGTQEKISS